MLAKLKLKTSNISYDSISYTYIRIYIIRKWSKWNHLVSAPDHCICFKH